MSVTGMSGIGGFRHLADPDISALRVLPVTGLGGASYQSFYLLSAINASGAGATQTALFNGGGYGAGFYFIQVSGNSATANFEVSPDGSFWSALTATAMGVNTTGFGQWSGYYPYIRGGIVWASGGVRTATVSVQLALK